MDNSASQRGGEVHATFAGRASIAIKVCADGRGRASSGAGLHWGVNSRRRIESAVATFQQSPLWGGAARPSIQGRISANGAFPFGRRRVFSRDRSFALCPQSADSCVRRMEPSVWIRPRERFQAKWIPVRSTKKTR